MSTAHAGPRASWLTRSGRAFAALLISFVVAVSWLLSPFRIGRLLRKVSLPRLYDHPLRTSVTIIGVITGVATVVAVTLVNRSVVHSAQSTVDDVAGRADLQVSASTGGFEESALDAARAAPGVFKATPVLQQTVRLAEQGLKSQRLLLLGFDLASSDDNYFRPHDTKEFDAINRDPIAFLDSASNIVISRSLADQLRKSLHDTIQVETPAGTKPFEIWGVLDDSDLARAFGGAVAIMHYQSMQAAFGRGLQIDRIDIAAAPGASLDQIEARLDRQYGGTLRVEVPEQKKTRLARMLVGLETAMSCAGVIAVLIAMFLIYNTMLISIVQRKAELGVLRSLGTTVGQVVRLLTLEGALLGAVGSALGVGFGLGAAYVMLALMSRSIGQIYMDVGTPTVHWDAPLLLTGFFFGALTAGLAAFVAARGAARVSPLESLRTATLVNVRSGRGRFGTADALALVLLASVIPLTRMVPPAHAALAAVASCFALLLGSALLVPRFVQLIHRAGAFFAGVGIEAQMANENLTRDLGRTSVTAGALMMGVAMAGAFGIFISSFVLSATRFIEESVPGDMFVMNPLSGAANMTPLPGEIGPALEAMKLKGVLDMQRVRVADFTYEGASVKLTSLEADLWSKHSKTTMVEGTQDGMAQGMLSGKAVGVSENFSMRFGKHLGDTLTLMSKHGPVAYRIAGVHVDYTSDLGVIWMNRAAYLDGWEDSSVDIYRMTAEEGADLEAMRATITAGLADRYDIMVMTGDEYVARLTGEMNQIFSLMRALQGVALLIAVMGVVNALSANILDRTREIGVMRAVGMLQKQVRKLIVIEASLMGICGSLSGLLVGIVCGRIMLTNVTTQLVGWSIPLAPNWLSLGEMVAAVIAASAIAGFFPARGAAAMRVPQAIGYR